MMEGIKLYIDYGSKRARPGSFLTAIICNNLRAAVMYADDENMVNIPAYVDYFYNHTPLDCWGSEERFENWQGLKGGD
jgi:hypothetical protein